MRARATPLSTVRPPARLNGRSCCMAWLWVGFGLALAWLRLDSGLAPACLCLASALPLPGFCRFSAVADLARTWLIELPTAHSKIAVTSINQLRRVSLEIKQADLALPDTGFPRALLGLGSNLARIWLGPGSDLVCLNADLMPPWL